MDWSYRDCNSTAVIGAEVTKPSVCLFVRLLSVYCLSFCLSASSFAHSFIHLFVISFICPSIYPFIYPSHPTHPITFTWKFPKALSIPYVFCLLFFVRANIIDFHRATGCDGTHPEMFSWIRRYFNYGLPNFNTGLAMGHQSNGVLNQTTRPPLYLQHQGSVDNFCLTCLILL